MTDLARRVRDLLEKLNWTQQRLADAVGVSQPSVSRWVRGEDEPEEIHLEKLADLARVTVAEFKYGHASDGSGSFLVPIVGAIGTGEQLNDFVGGASADIERVPLPPELEAEGIVAIRIQGNSMRPLRDGWILYYRPEEGVADSALGELCVVRLASGKQFVKEIRRGTAPGRYTLSSWNANVDPMEDQDVLSASIVRAIRRP